MGGGVRRVALISEAFSIPCPVEVIASLGRAFFAQNQFLEPSQKRRHRAELELTDYSNNRMWSIWLFLLDLSHVILVGAISAWFVAPFQRWGFFECRKTLSAYATTVYDFEFFGAEAPKKLIFPKYFCVTNPYGIYTYDEIVFESNTFESQTLATYRLTTKKYLGKVCARTTPKSQNRRRRKPLRNKDLQKSREFGLAIQPISNPGELKGHQSCH